MNREEIALILMDLAGVEGSGVFLEDDGTVSFNGFNQKTYDAYRKSKNLPPKDVTTITVDESIDIINDEFINRNGIEKLPKDIIPLVVDMSFNSGPANAAKTLQMTVGAEPDGIIGKKTLKALEDYRKENNIIDGFSNGRIKFLEESNSPSVMNNMNGLLNRVEKVRQRELNRAGSGVIAK